MISLYVANTDNDWFDFLSAEPGIAEVNFWQPSAMNFRAIGPGELFAFRLKSPRNKIGGFGVFSSSSILPLQIAWETFRRANGAASAAELQRMIAKLRPDDTVGPTTNIGCRILVDAVFFPPAFWFDLPPSWSQNIMGGKRFVRIPQTASISGTGCNRPLKNCRRPPRPASQNPQHATARRR